MWGCMCIYHEHVTKSKMVTTRQKQRGEIAIESAMTVPRLVIISAMLRYWPTTITSKQVAGDGSD